MKNILTLCIATIVLFSGCEINKKAQMEALGQCTYNIESMDRLTIGGQPVNNFMKNGQVNLAVLPSMALLLLSKDVPLEAQVNMKITNPVAKKAAMNSFKYLIEIQGKPVFEGTVDENINLDQNQSTTIPLTFKANIFGVAKEAGFENFLNEMLTRKSEGFIALKIKPSIKIGNSNIYYPGYITVDNNLMQRIKF
ncbi:hypothetical protein [Sphingobacterium hungaricum]